MEMRYQIMLKGPGTVTSGQSAQDWGALGHTYLGGMNVDSSRRTNQRFLINDVMNALSAMSGTVMSHSLEIVEMQSELSEIVETIRRTNAAIECLSENNLNIENQFKPQQNNCGKVIYLFNDNGKGH